MPEIPNVVSGEPVIADWGNDIRDRVITRYADDTARTASLPFPAPGQVTWIETPGVLEVWTGAAWITLALEPALAAFVVKTGDLMTGLLTVPDLQFSGTLGAIKDGLGQNRIILSDAGDVTLAGTDGVSRVDIKDDLVATGINSASGRNILISTNPPSPTWGKDGDIAIRFTAALD